MTVLKKLIVLSIGLGMLQSVFLSHAEVHGTPIDNANAVSLFLSLAPAGEKRELCIEEVIETKPDYSGLDANITQGLAACGMFHLKSAAELAPAALETYLPDEASILVTSTGLSLSKRVKGLTCKDALKRIEAQCPLTASR